MCWGDGSPRARAPLTAALFPQRLPSGKVGFSKAMSNKWIRVDKSAADGPRVFRVVSPCWKAVGQVGRAGGPLALRVSHTHPCGRWTAWRMRCSAGSSWSGVGRLRSW